MKNGPFINWDSRLGLTPDRRIGVHIPSGEPSAGSQYGATPLGPLSWRMTVRMKFPDFRLPRAISSKLHLWFLISINILVMSCATTSTTTQSRRQAQEPRGFFGSLMDQMTERECNVGRFICPFGLGPAGETCTCTDPSGVVLTGRTIK